VPLSSTHLKKLKLNVEAMCHEKTRSEKEKTKKKDATKGKAKLRVEGDKDYVQTIDDYNDYDDFM